MVNEIVTISQVGRAPRQSPGIFALAIIMTFAKPDGDMDFAENDIQEQKTFKADQIAAMQKVCIALDAGTHSLHKPRALKCPAHPALPIKIYLSCIYCLMQMSFGLRSKYTC